MKTRYPAVNVEGGPLYVQDGPVWTSGGVSSGFDLTLALVEDDYGFTLARNVAQDMVMYLRRHGGQLQFSRYNLEQSGATGPVSELQSWILQNLTADLCVERLAERVAMSPRNFTRVFTRDVGVPPARYVTEARLAAARQLLEQTPYPLEVIAEKAGLGPASTCAAFLKSSFISRRANIASVSTAAEWRNLILFVIYANRPDTYSNSRQHR